MQYIDALCEQNAKLDKIFNTGGLDAKTYERVNFALSLCGHLLDEILRPQYNSTYFEMQFAKLISNVDALSSRTNGDCYV